MKNIFLVLLIFSLLSGCSNQKTKEPEKAGVKFCVPDSLMSQIRLDTVDIKPVFNELNLIGKVTFDQEKVVRIYPLVSGNVVDVRVTLGSHVEKGQILAIIKSSEMAGAENDHVTASSNLAIAEKNFAAATDMNKSGILSDKEFTTAQKELDKAKSEFERSSTVLSIYGNSSQHDYLVKAPISGFIVEKFVNTNMQIRADNSSSLFTISDLKNVWVLANVYESDIAGIQENEKVEITTISYPDKKYIGKIDKIYNMLDPDNKTMKVQIKLNNDDYKLKPEMFAKVMVHQITDNKMLAIPSEAVIFDRNRYWVLVFNNKCDIQTRKIEKVVQNSRYTYVSTGIKSGEKVITNRQLLIYSAINQ
jgi:cobalt-zinc-cadmium efflux system membrane fusion protein